MICALFLFLIRFLVSWYNRPALVLFNVGRCDLQRKNSFPYQLLYITRWWFCTNPSDKMLAIPFGLYQTGFGYPQRPSILSVHPTPALQFKHRYFLSLASLMFYIYLQLMRALHVDWLSKKYQFWSVLDPSTVDRMLSSTRIMVSLILFCENASWDYSVLD